MSNLPTRCVTPGGERFRRWQADRAARDTGITADYFNGRNDRDRERLGRQLVALFDNDTESAVQFIRRLFRRDR